jgi:peptidoglycan hydrolase-like protein with peptidoglycan-binding domain
MTYKNLQPGSTGEDVKKLQQALGFTGSDVDGIYGGNTEGAVMRYQMQHGLAETGVADENMLNHLYSNQKTTTSTPATTTPSTTVKPESDVPKVNTPTTNNSATSQYFAPSSAYSEARQKEKDILAQRPEDFAYGQYAKDESVLQAEALLNQWINNKPGEYTPVFENEANSYLSKYQDRDPFSYDFNSDALYNQYKDQYIQQGRMAMMDTMGQAAAMTGGYGNSYAQTVGQQAYNQQLGQLNEIMPELYGMAYDRYNQEGQDLLNMYSLYMDKENKERNDYQTELGNWYSYLDVLRNDAERKSEESYNRWYDSETMRHNEWQDNYNTWYDEYATAANEADDLYAREYNEWVDNVNMNATTPVEYTKLTAEETTKWQKLFGQETTDSGIEMIGDSMEAAGFPPELVAGWVDYYKGLISVKKGVVPPSGNYNGQPYGVSNVLK